MSKSQLRVRLPTLLIIGQQDTVFNVYEASACFEHVDRFHYEVIDGASHWISRERPEEVNNLVAKFLGLSLLLNLLFQLKTQRKD